MEKIIVSAFGILLTAFIAERFYTVHKKRTNFDKEYSKFSEPLLNFLNTMQDNGASLNYLLLTEFKGHRASKNIFISNLKGRYLDSFNKKWAEYEEQYQEVAGGGVFGIGAAIAPSLEALQGATPDDPPKWEADRKQKIHAIITELLEISKPKIWF